MPRPKAPSRKKAKKEIQTPQSTDTGEHHVAAPSLLLALPDEIYLEIAHYFESIPIPTPIHYKGDGLAHRQTLVTLTQTSRGLRRVFLPFLWKRVEVYPGMLLDGRPIQNWETRHDYPLSHPENKRIAEAIIDQLETVTIRAPDLAQYVQVVNVAVQGYCFENVLRELANSLPMLPKAHTVQIIFEDKLKTLQVKRICERTFKGHNFPQVTHIVAPCSTMSHLIKACPNVERLDFGMNDTTNNWAWIPECLQSPRLRVVGSLPPSRYYHNHFAASLNALGTNIQEVVFAYKHMRLGIHTLRLVSRFPQLRIFCIQPTGPRNNGLYKRETGSWSWPLVLEPRENQIDPATQTEMANWVNLATTICMEGANPNHDQQRIVLVYTNGTQQTFEPALIHRGQPVELLSDSEP